MTRDDTIIHDLPCRACAYNLRGLSAEGLCPECAEPIRNSYSSEISHLAKVLDEDPHTVASRLHYEKIATGIGCSVDALLFVFDTYRQTRSIDPAKNVTAADICGALRAYARKYFNNEAEARELLQDWGITRSEDVGKIIFGLVQEGLIQTSEGDRIEQFEGLFTLENLL